MVAQDDTVGCEIFKSYFAASSHCGLCYCHACYSFIPKITVKAHQFKLSVKIRLKLTSKTANIKTVIILAILQYGISMVNSAYIDAQ